MNISRTLIVRPGGLRPVIGINAFPYAGDRGKKD